jgi:hypothetical protein
MPYDVDIEREELSEVIKEVPSLFSRVGILFISGMLGMVILMLGIMVYPEKMIIPVKVGPVTSEYVYVVPKGARVDVYGKGNGKTVSVGDTLCSARSSVGGGDCYVRSPIEGRFFYQEDYYSEQWNVVVVPTDSSYLVTGQADEKQRRNLFKGQQIDITLRGSRGSEYGHLTGVIDEIAAVPVGGIYSFRVKLDGVQKTSRAVLSDLWQKMEGVGEVNTGSRSVLKTMARNWLP